jgi:transcription antitermination factor NusA-like protein
MKILLAFIFGIIVTVATYIVAGREIISFFSKSWRIFKWHFGKVKKEKRKLAVDFETAINNTIERFAFGDRLVSQTFVKGIPVQKCKMDELLGDLESERLIIKIPANYSEEEVCAKIATDYSRSYFLRREKPFMGTDIRVALDISFAKQILWYANRRKALSDVYREFYGEDHFDNKWLDKIDTLNNNLVFYYILLSELIFSVDDFEFDIPSRKHMDKIYGISEFIYEVSVHESGFLDHKESGISIIIFANPAKLKRVGIIQHQYKIEECINKGSSRIYLAVGGKEAIRPAKALKRLYHEAGQVDLLFEKDLEAFTKQSGYISCIKPKKEFAKKSALEEKKDLIIKVIAEYVPEYNSGYIGIYSIYYNETDKSAILFLFSSDKEKYPDIGAAFGRKWERFHAIKKALNLQYLRFCEYKEEDVFSTVCVALNTKEEEEKDIKSIVFKEDINIYKVIVENKETCAKLIGRQGRRIKIAQYLLKAAIDVDVVTTNNSE